MKSEAGKNVNSHEMMMMTPEKAVEDEGRGRRKEKEVGQKHDSWSEELEKRRWEDVVLCPQCLLSLLNLFLFLSVCWRREVREERQSYSFVIILSLPVFARGVFLTLSSLFCLLFSVLLSFFLFPKNKWCNDRHHHERHQKEVFLGEKTRHKVIVKETGRTGQINSSSFILRHEQNQNLLPEEKSEGQQHLGHHHHHSERRK